MPPLLATDRDTQTMAPLSTVGHYPELKRRVRDAGLFAPQPRYYVWKTVITAGLTGIALLFVFASHNPWWRSCAAAFLAAVFAQISFIGHDVGHRQVVQSRRLYLVFSLIVGNLLVGVSATWWQTKHNLHHGHPNRPGFDPDVTLPIVAFTAGRAQAMNRAQRLVVRNQHLLFLALLLGEGIVLRFSSIQFLIARRGRHWLLELALIAAHAAIWSFIVFRQFGFGPGLGFIAVQQMCYGLYMGLVFAPNHKGMAELEPAEADDFLLEQVLGSRNVRPHPIVDFVYGGLNYQIEHHLFPTLARNRLRAAQPLVQAFCAERGIPYCQTGLVAAYRDIFKHLYGVSRAARTAAPKARGGLPAERSVGS